MIKAILGTHMEWIGRIRAPWINLPVGNHCSILSPCNNNQYGSNNTASKVTKRNHVLNSLHDACKYRHNFPLARLQ